MKFSTTEIVATLSLLSLPTLAQDASACPGIFAVTSGAVSGCCVGAPTPTSEHAKLEARATRTAARAAATTVVTTKRRTKTKTTKTSSSTVEPLTCATWIPATQSNYTGLLHEASMSWNSTGTNLRTTITPVRTGAAATSSSAGDATLDLLPLWGINTAALVAAVLGWLI